MNLNDMNIGEGLLPGYKTREEIEKDLISRTTSLSERDDIEQTLHSHIKSESIKEEEERAMKEMEEKELHEALNASRFPFSSSSSSSSLLPPDFMFDFLDDIDAEEKLMEVVKWDSIREQ
jgi:hypothetical protein